MLHRSKRTHGILMILLAISVTLAGCRGGDKGKVGSYRVEGAVPAGSAASSGSTSAASSAPVQGASAPTPNTVANPNLVDQNFSTRDIGTLSAYLKGSQYNGGRLEVIRDDVAWNDLWKQHSQGLSGKPAAPKVDFKHQMVVAYFMGAKTTVGHKTRITRVQADAATGDFVVTVREESPAPWGHAAARLTTPFHFVSTARQPGKATIVRHTVVPTRELSRGDTSGYEFGNTSFGGAVLLFQDQASFNTFYQQHGTQTGSTQAPAIDFQKHSVMAVLQGARPSSGYGIEVHDLLFDEGSGSLRLTSIVDETGNQNAQQTNPYQIVLLPRTTGTVVEERAQKLPIDRIAQGANSRISGPRGMRYVIRNQGNLEKIWKAHTGSLKGLPTINWNKEMVVAAFMGSRPTGGYGVEVSQIVTLPGGSVEVEITNTTPQNSPGNMQTAAQTAPFDIVKTDMVLGQVSFK